MTRLRLVCLLVLLAAGPARGQLIDWPTFGQDWTTFVTPKLYYAGPDGAGFGLYYAQINQLGFDEWDAPPPYRAMVSVDANITTSGTKRLELALRAPQWVDGWRFVLSLEGRRDARQRYFGIGNSSVFDKALETDSSKFYYRSKNTRWIGRGEVQRRIVGGLRLLVGLHAEHWTIDTLRGPSQLAADLAAGVDPTIAEGTAEIAGRIGLVFDTRNDEPAPTKGVLLQGIVSFADSSILGDLSYTRTTLSATGYLPLTARLRIAARVAGESTSGSPRIGTYYRIESSDRFFRGIGGSESHRALPTRRLLDGDKLLGNLDLRYDLFAYPTLFRVTGVGFLDAARVFSAGEIEFTTSDLSVGGGVGLILQFFRAGFLGVSSGVGPDGLVWSFHTWWPF